jgi:hypothetical protein
MTVRKQAGHAADAKDQLSRNFESTVAILTRDAFFRLHSCISQNRNLVAET